MKKYKRYIPLILGITILAIVLGRFGISRLQDTLALRRAHDLVAQLQQLLPEIRKGTWDDRIDMDMPVLQVGGEDLCAWLQVPAFGTDLPVNNRWSSRDLSSLPCRYYGSIYDGTLVIGGSTQTGQLDFCHRIDTGHAVMITDMTGARYSYTVSIVERYSAIDAELLMDEKYDLTLYVKDSADDVYILVRCTMAG